MLPPKLSLLFTIGENKTMSQAIFTKTQYNSSHYQDENIPIDQRIDRNVKKLHHMMKSYEYRMNHIDDVLGEIIEHILEIKRK